MVNTAAIISDQVSPKQAGAGLVVRLATNDDEIAAAQRLRYRVFYERMGATPTVQMAALGRDIDEFDAVCDHLLVIAPGLAEETMGVVGTYRLLRADHPGFKRFYTASEYDIRAIMAYPGRVLELGRSCVDERYRGKAIKQTLWQGVARYVFSHGIDLMFGCASLPGTDLDALAPVLTYLHHNRLAPVGIRPRALPELRVEMNRLPGLAADAALVRPLLPPLLKGYLRLGGFIGDGAVIDRQFNTTDVCLIVKTDEVADRYVRHYGLAAERPH